MRENNRIGAVAFGLDHTLYDRNATLQNFLPAFLRQFEAQRNPTLTPKALLALLWETDLRSVYDETGWRGMHALLLERGAYRTDPGFDAFYRFLCGNFPGVMQPYPDTYATLRWCRQAGYKLALITNGHPGFQADKIAAMRLGEYLDEILVCNLDTGYQCKPDPAPFLEMARRLDLPPRRIVYVGDNPVNDIEGARGAGMIPVWLSVMGCWKEGIAKASYEIGSLSQLPALLRQMEDDGGTAAPAITPDPCAQSARTDDRRRKNG